MNLSRIVGKSNYPGPGTYQTISRSSSNSLDLPVKRFSLSYGFGKDRKCKFFDEWIKNSGRLNRNSRSRQIFVFN